MTTYTNTHIEQIEIQTPLRNDVPFVCDDWTLAFRLGFTGKTLWYITKHRQRLYKEFGVKKKTGGVRRTFNPTDLMRVFHTQLRSRILLPLCKTLGPHVAAYQTDRSTVDAAAAHIRPCDICDMTTAPRTKNVKHQCPRMGSKFKLDLRDFFLSTTPSMIRNYFHRSVGYNHYVSSLLATVLTVPYRAGKSRLLTGVPPGAITAGDICNLVADYAIDRHIQKALPDWTYTRYADDLYFSHAKNLPRGQVNAAIKTVTQIINAAGYRVNRKKTRVQQWTRPQKLLGININRKLNVPKKDYQLLHNTIYNIKKHGFEHARVHMKKETVAKLHHWIIGKINYFKQISPDKAEKLTTLYAQAQNAQVNSTADMLTLLETSTVIPPLTLSEESRSP